MRSSSRRWWYAWILAVCVVPESLAWLPVGRGKLIGSTEARIDYDSNIFLNSRGGEDFSGTVKGEVRYVRDSGVVTMEAAAGATTVKFIEFDNQSGTDPYVEGKAAYTPSDKTDWQGNASYRRNSVANDAVSDRTKSNDLVADGTFEHRATEKLGWRLTGAFSSAHYLTADYSDVSRYSFGAHAVHTYSPKLKLLAGVTRAESWTSEGDATRTKASAEDWRYSLGAEGEFAPKITGDLSVGFVQRDLGHAAFANDQALFLASRVVWAASEKTTVTVGVRQDLTLSAADQSVKSFDASVGVTRNLTAKLTAEVGVSHTRADYTGVRAAAKRSDDGYAVRAAGRYTLSDRVALEAAAGYRENRSTQAVAAYHRVTTSVRITVRF